MHTFFDDYAIVYTFSRKVTWTLSPFQQLLYKSSMHSIFTYCGCVRCEVLINNNRLSFCKYILYWWPVGDANSIGCYGGGRRSSPPELLLDKGVLKLCNMFTREHPRWSVISIKLQSNFAEIKLRHGCYPVNFLQIFRKTFPKNNFGGLLL